MDANFPQIWPTERPRQLCPPSDQQREGAREEWSMPQTDFSAETVAASFFLGVKSVLPIKEGGGGTAYSTVTFG